jgi:hypothetical protein
VTPAETAKLLALCAAYDNRTTGRADTAAWHQVVGDFTYADAQAAVVAYYRDNRERIMPADVRRGVSAIRRARVERVRDEDLVPDAHLMSDPRAILRVLQARRDLVLNGMSPDDAIRHSFDPKVVDAESRYELN